jgi:two-component system, OmpR family, response regulator
VIHRRTDLTTRWCMELGVVVRILLIEDDETTAAYIEKGLRQAGHDVDRTTDGRDGITKATSTNYDAAVIDRMLPGLDGLALVKSLRSTGIRMPVLLLTALGAIDDRVAGLEAGADDYLTKPFAFPELMARLNALGRRPPITEPTTLQVGDLVMDLVGRTVHREGRPIALLPREFKLLEVLMRNRGRLVTRTMLLERVWDFQFDPKTSVVETHVSRLRAKLDRPFGDAMIRTERGMGYILDVPQAADSVATND